MVFYGLLIFFCTSLFWCTVSLIQLRLKSRLSSKNTATLTAVKELKSKPLYLVLGPKQAGKTELLRKAELHKLPDISGDIHYWTNSTVMLLDLPSDYIHLFPLWNNLLHQLKKIRSKKSIVNGIILAIDAETLSKPFDILLKNIQDRLRELSSLLKLPAKKILPLYVVCTQTDKLQGFSDYFDDLGKTEREQHLGITFPVNSDSKNSPSELFSDTFDKLLQNLHQRSLWRVHHERDFSKRRVIQQFPYQLGSLKENLQKCMASLNALNLRGVYFTSSLFESEEEFKINAVQDSLEKHFALLPLQHSSAMAGVNSQNAFFIKQLFEHRIFPEASLTTRNSIATPHSSALKIGPFLSLSILGTALIAVTLVWFNQYQQQKNYLLTAKTALTNYKILAVKAKETPHDLRVFIPVLQALNLAHQTIADAKLSTLLKFQLHHKQPLSHLTTVLYHKELEQYFMPAVQENIAAQLKNNATGDNTDSGNLYSLLKTYILISQPTTPTNQTSHDTFLINFFNKTWQNPVKKNPDFMEYLAAGLKNQTQPIPMDTDLLTQVRATLNALPYTLLAEAILQNQSRPVTSNMIDDALSEAIQGGAVLGPKPDADITLEQVKTFRDDLVKNYNNK